MENNKLALAPYENILTDINHMSRNRVFTLLKCNNKCPRCGFVKYEDHHSVTVIDKPRCCGITKGIWWWKKRLCPTSIVHAHARCLNCKSEWLEKTPDQRSEEHTSELQSHSDLVC